MNDTLIAVEGVLARGLSSPAAGSLQLIGTPLGNLGKSRPLTRVTMTISLQDSIKNLMSSLNVTLTLRMVRGTENMFNSLFFVN